MIQRTILFVAFCLTFSNIAAASTDFTTYADLDFKMAPQVKYLVKCVPQVTSRTEKMNVIVRQLVSTGKLQMLVSKSAVGRTSQDIYDVRYLPPVANRPGSPAVYQGREVQLSIHWTATGNPDGFPGLLKTLSSAYQLRCKHYTQYVY